MQSTNQRMPASKDAVADALKQLLQADPSLRATILGSLGEGDGAQTGKAAESSPAVSSDEGSTASPADSDSEANTSNNAYIPPPPGLELNEEATANSAAQDVSAAAEPLPMGKAAKDLQAAIAHLQNAADAFQNEQKRMQEDRLQQQSAHMAQLAQDQQTHAVAQAAAVAAADAAKKIAESFTSAPPAIANAFEAQNQQRSRLSISAAAYVPAAAGGAPGWFPTSAAPCWPQVSDTYAATHEDWHAAMLQAQAPQMQEWDAQNANLTEPFTRSWANAGPKPLAKSFTSARTSTGKQLKSDVGAAKEEEKEDTLRTHLQELEEKDPERIIIARKINRLGFESPQILKAHFGKFGVVDDVLVSHSHVRCQNGNAATRLRPSGLGFIVMENAEDAKAIQAQGEHQNVAGAMIRLYPFKKRIALAEGIEEKGEAWK